VDEGLEENLVTFFEQKYPLFEILFAVRTPDDPAIAVVERFASTIPFGPLTADRKPVNRRTERQSL